MPHQLVGRFLWKLLCVWSFSNSLSGGICFTNRPQREIKANHYSVDGWSIVGRYYKGAGKLVVAGKRCANRYFPGEILIATLYLVI